MEYYEPMQNWEAAYGALSTIRTGSFEEEEQLNIYRKSLVKSLETQTIEMIRIALGGIDQLQRQEEQYEKLKKYLMLAIVLQFLFKAENHYVPRYQMIYGE